MKKMYFSFLMMVVMCGLYAQNKGYVYKPAPSEYVAAKKLNVANVCVSIDDARILHPKTKVSCKLSDIESAIIKSLNTAFTETKFSTEKSEATLEITIKQYEAFARGVVWIGIT